MNENVINWLLEEENPSVRYRTLTELLDRPPDDSEVVRAREQIPSSVAVTNILDRMHPDGYWLWKKQNLSSFRALALQPRFLHFMGIPP